MLCYQIYNWQRKQIYQRVSKIMIFYCKENFKENLFLIDTLLKFMKEKIPNSVPSVVTMHVILEHWKNISKLFMKEKDHFHTIYVVKHSRVKVNIILIFPLFMIKRNLSLVKSVVKGFLTKRILEGTKTHMEMLDHIGVPFVMLNLH